MHLCHNWWLAEWASGWSDDDVVKLYGEMVEEDDEVGDCSGWEGDRIEVDGITSL
jgi:hypothetical protein